MNLKDALLTSACFVLERAGLASSNIGGAFVTQAQVVADWLGGPWLLYLLQRNQPRAV